MHFYDPNSSVPPEQQPRVRGWLLASVDGQNAGLVPANYVKILGKRRGRRQAELERLAQLQQGQQATSSAPNQVTVTMPASASASAGQPGPEELLESVYRETPVSYTSPAVTVNNGSTNTAVGNTEKLDL